MNRGNRKAQIFIDDLDRRRFSRILLEEQKTHGVKVCSECQMGTHFHLIVTTPRGNLSDFVGAFEGRFADYSNRRHGNVGHLYQGRFVDVVIEDDVQLLTALCYVFLNPVSAGLVTRIEDYPWSTYRATAGLGPAPPYLSLEWLESLYPGEPLKDAQQHFRALMNEAQPVVVVLRSTERGSRPLRGEAGRALLRRREPAPWTTPAAIPVGTEGQLVGTVSAGSWPVGTAHPHL